VVPNLSGEVMLSFFAPVALGSYVKDGRLRALAAGSAKRTPSMPDLPTFAEAGFPGVEVTPWYGVHASAKTPKSIIERLHREFVKVLRIPDVKDMLMKQGLEIVANTPGEFSAIIKEEIARWTKLFKEAKIEIE
jgi:tripartite-type tricarboxylate transporter receptor subunit TctC